MPSCQSWTGKLQSLSNVHEFDGHDDQGLSKVSCQKKNPKKNNSNNKNAICRVFTEQFQQVFTNDNMSNITECKFGRSFYVLWKERCPYFV